ncbi:HD-GYP domain-containing protein [Massilia sp. S19_KUP03_FR1]|uniref:HD-GYP domain-containing protein n=1 Tax=Massilia sp. S19_KUP03_FR1 TaxID=3025503 RepID=UPI002FCD8871
MLKKISLEQLQVRMYVHELCGPWMDSPFWKKSFMVDDQATLVKIGSTHFDAVWIDTAKGKDVALAALAPPPPAPQVAAKDAPKPVPASMDEEMGRAARIVDKSRQAVMLMFNEARMGAAVDVDNAQDLVEEISASVMRNPGALISLARLKSADDYTYMHSVAVCALMIALATRMGLDEAGIHEAGMAGLLHDLGKAVTDPDILNKPGKLTDAEFAVVRQHPVLGYDILLLANGVSPIVLDVCRHHHEKMDGSGYPDRLAGDQISLYARMGAVCDIYDAITSDRPYKKGWCPAESLRKMAEWTNGHLDPVVFQAFVKGMGIYPVGTLVRLESGKLGVVVEQQVGKSLLKPKVRVFFSSKSKAYIAAELIDLARPGMQDKIVAHENPEKWGLKDIDRYWLNGGATAH